MVNELFGATAKHFDKAKGGELQRNKADGIGFAGANSAALAEAITRAIPRDFDPEGAGQVLHRKIGDRDVFMVMGAPKNSRCFFRATGLAELWDPWTGKTEPILAKNEGDGGAYLRMPRGADEAQIIVFTPGTDEHVVTSTDLDDVTSIDETDGKVAVTGYSDTPGGKTAIVTGKGGPRTLSGEAVADPAPMPVTGPWEFELVPVMDNQWGDFRLPVEDKVIGAEARRFAYAEEKEVNPGWERPETDDSRWRKETHGFGQRFWKLGPLPADADLAALEKELAAQTQVDAAKPVVVNGKEYRWQAYEYSTRWGVEGDPGPQGHHGLKEMISDDFIVLGKPDYTGIEIEYQAEPEGNRYYLWTAAQVSSAIEANVCMGKMKPAAAYVNGEALSSDSAKVPLRAGFNPVLLRYDQTGRAHFVLDSGIPAKEPRTPLAMSWHDKPGVLAFNAAPDEKKPVGWYRFVSPPGLKAMRFAVHGKVKAWADGKPVKLEQGAQRPDGSRDHTGTVVNPSVKATVVALRIEQEPGCVGGAALPEPVRLECGKGEMETGDWAKAGVLEHYSGGAWYRKNVTLADTQTKGRVMLNLGTVVASAEVHVNGKKAGTRLTPPWKLDISEFVIPGENRIEIYVCNTLANHFGTIPTHYRGDPASGLIGPVTIEVKNKVILK